MPEQDVSHHRVARGAGDRHGRSTYNRSVADNSPSLFRSPAFIVPVVYFFFPETNGRSLEDM